MLLAVDIGNTDVVFGIHNKETWVHQWRHPSSKYTSVQSALNNFAERDKVALKAFDQVIISSVVPGITPEIQKTVRKLTGKKPLMVGPAMYNDLELEIDNPEEIGTDLVSNAVAGYHRFQQSCIVVDFGTALTFTVVDDKGKILGVSIAPGLKTAMNALFFNTAQLPVVPLELPKSAIGKNTAHALQAGILLGYVGLVREMLDRIQAELPTPSKVIATGGLSRILTPLAERFDEIDQLLTLDGLRLMADEKRK